MRIAAIYSGCDWADASVSLLVAPDGADVKADVQSYPGYSVSILHLPEWLIEAKGYRHPTEREVIEVGGD